MKEKTEEQKEEAGLFTWDGTVLYRYVNEYKHDSYLTGLARQVQEMGVTLVALQSTHTVKSLSL